GLSIQEIYGIEHLQKLEDLDLSSNLISDISYLIDLQKLRNLNLGNNQITNISALAALPKLTNINLEGNLIADISPLVMNTELGVGVQIDLRHNNLGLTPGSENMKDL
ncbi:MAG TPA: leucine-rich repeat domain-containing protein, partial [Firmicutes bacterium]|nr:leucine-rich repeat domain-containing protein [Bacillota bacterium]